MQNCLAERGERVVKTGTLLALTRSGCHGCPLSWRKYAVVLTADSVHLFRSTMKTRSGGYNVVATSDVPEHSFHLDSSVSCIGLPYGHSLQYFAILGFRPEDTRRFSSRGKLKIELQAATDVECSQWIIALEKQLNELRTPSDLPTAEGPPSASPRLAKQPSRLENLMQGSLSRISRAFSQQFGAAGATPGLESDHRTDNASEEAPTLERQSSSRLRSLLSAAPVSSVQSISGMRSGVAQTLQVSAASSNPDDAPLLARQPSDVAAIFEVPAASVRALVEMGFEAETAARALLQTQDMSVTAALDVLSAGLDEAQTEAGAPLQEMPGAAGATLHGITQSSGPAIEVGKVAGPGASAGPSRKMQRQDSIEAGAKSNQGPTEEYKCPICQMEMDATEGGGTGKAVCGHVAHADCMREYLAFSLMNGSVLNIKCPACPRVLTQDEITARLSAEMLPRYREFWRSQLLTADPTIRWCQAPGCGRPIRGYKEYQPPSMTQAVVQSAASAGFVYAAMMAILWLLDRLMAGEGGREDGGNVTVALNQTESGTGGDAWARVAISGQAQVAVLAVCVWVATMGMLLLRRRSEERAELTRIYGRVSACRCGCKVCFNCKGRWHPGVRCQVMQSKDLCKLMEWSDGKDVGKCPKCDALIERIDGCNHITCRCGNEFCWLCGEDYANGCIRTGKCQQFGGTRKNKDLDMVERRDHDPAERRRRVVATAIANLSAFVLVALVQRHRVLPAGWPDADALQQTVAARPCTVTLCVGLLSFAVRAFVPQLQADEQHAVRASWNTVGDLGVRWAGERLAVIRQHRWVPNLIIGFGVEFQLLMFMIFLGIGNWIAGGLQGVDKAFSCSSREQWLLGSEFLGRYLGLSLAHSAGILVQLRTAFCLMGVASLVYGGNQRHRDKAVTLLLLRPSIWLLLGLGTILGQTMAWNAIMSHVIPLVCNYQYPGRRANAIGGGMTLSFETPGVVATVTAMRLLAAFALVLQCSSSISLRSGPAKCTDVVQGGNRLFTAAFYLAKMVAVTNTCARFWQRAFPRVRRRRAWISTACSLIGAVVALVLGLPFLYAFIWLAPHVPTDEWMDRVAVCLLVGLLPVWACTTSITAEPLPLTLEQT